MPDEEPRIFLSTARRLPKTAFEAWWLDLVFKYDFSTFEVTFDP